MKQPQMKYQRVVITANTGRIYDFNFLFQISIFFQFLLFTVSVCNSNLTIRYSFKSKQIHIGAAALNTKRVESANAPNMQLQNSFKLKFASFFFLG